MSLSTPTPNQWHLQGDLGFIEVPTVESHCRKLRKKVVPSEPWVISFKEVDRIDSAGMAWILENISYAKEQHISLVFEQLGAENSSFCELANVQGVSELLQAHIEI